MNKDYNYSIFGSLINSALSYFFFLILINNYSVDEYGLFVKVMAFASFLFMIFGLGINEKITSSALSKDKFINLLFSVAVLKNTILYIFLILLSESLGSLLHPNLSGDLLVATLTLCLIDSIYVSSIMIQRIKGLFSNEFYFSISKSISRTGILLIAINSGCNILELLYILIFCYSIILLSLLLQLSKRGVFIRFTNYKNIIIVINNSFKYFIPELLANLKSNSDLYILTFWGSATYIAFYNAALQFYQAGLQLLVSFSNVFTVNYLKGISSFGFEIFSRTKILVALNIGVGSYILLGHSFSRLISYIFLPSSYGDAELYIYGVLFLLMMKFIDLILIYPYSIKKNAIWKYSKLNFTAYIVQVLLQFIVLFSYGQEYLIIPAMLVQYLFISFIILSYKKL